MVMRHSSAQLFERSGTIVDARGIATFCVDLGDGDPVMLLHGSGPGVSAWANWFGNIPALAERFRVLAPDLVGWGDTERPHAVEYGLRTWVDQCFGVLDALGIDRCSIVGNSLGGRLALAMAAWQPQRVPRMVLMGAAGPDLVPTPALIAGRSYEPSIENMDRLLREAFAFDPTIVDEELVRIRHEASVAPGAHDAYMTMFAQDVGANTALPNHEIAQIDVPTLVVHGREDAVVPVECGIQLSQLIPRADLLVFGQCGHWTQIEHRDRFNELVGSFLARA
jgi:pimeloyl-ACP methyl ester carboxylesterase